MHDSQSTRLGRYRTDLANDFDPVDGGTKRAQASRNFQVYCSQYNTVSRGLLMIDFHSIKKVERPITIRIVDHHDFRNFGHKFSNTANARLYYRRTECSFAIIMRLYEEKMDIFLIIISLSIL